MTETHRGSLVIADISGYTQYLTGVELDHSQDILAELISGIVDTLGLCFTLAKLEGDAVFCYDTALEPDGQVVLTALETTYFAFRKRLRAIEHMTTCTCAACRSAAGLDLKIVAHHGAFLISEVAGRPELLGPDVIAVHRLLKNEVIERTGFSAYAFLTDALLKACGLELSDGRTHVEKIDTGRQSGRVLDLAERWGRAEQAVEAYVRSEDAFLEVVTEIPDASLPVVWELTTSPIKRVEWLDSLVRNTEDLVWGERRTGARNHCVHSTPQGEMDFYHEVVDWKPFSYFTEHSRGPLGETYDLWEFEELRGNVVRFTFRTANAPGVTGPEQFAAIIESSIHKSVGPLTALAQARTRETATARTGSGEDVTSA
ncbi:MAG: DUF2652 domain-containing protein [Actinobacteria bacterium]|nr:DUF2652 domain-containing protein [Actinomycetota bacterium]